MKIPCLQSKILLESNPLKSKVLVRRLAVESVAPSFLVRNRSLEVLGGETGLIEMHHGESALIEMHHGISAHIIPRLFKQTNAHERTYQQN